MHHLLLLPCIHYIATEAEATVEVEVEDRPQISITSTDSLEAELDALRAGLNNAPPGAKSYLETLQEKVSASDAIKFVPRENVAQTIAATTTTSPILLEDRHHHRHHHENAPKDDSGLDSVKKKMTSSVNNIDNHLRRIVQDVDSIVRTKQQFTQAVKSGAASEIKSYQAAKRKMNSKGKAKPRQFKARTAKDVIDCTACRYAWLRVEQDLGNTYSEKALYDAFVTTCANMQMTNIFFSSCNDMFAQVDDMIGDYLNGKTVNQLCMHARMCR